MGDSPTLFVVLSGPGGKGGISNTWLAGRVMGLKRGPGFRLNTLWTPVSSGIFINSTLSNLQRSRRVREIPSVWLLLFHPLIPQRRRIHLLKGRRYLQTTTTACVLPVFSLPVSISNKLQEAAAKTPVGFFRKTLGVIPSQFSRSALDY